MNQDLWSIVLAGGEGERLRPLIERWLGRHRPKQYCTFVGTRSLFQHTLDRADLLTSPERKIVVIAERHRKEACQQLQGRLSARVILQPLNRDTAPGIFLPLTYVRAANPDATVVIYPSDHYINPEERFMDFVRQATRAVDASPELLVLLGVFPEGVETEYGWIEPGRPVRRKGCRLRKVQSFIEKPQRSVAEGALARRALWNTLVVVGKVEKLWQLGWRCFPEMMVLFEMFAQAIDTPEESDLLGSLYSVMPSRNFSTNLLERVVEDVAVLELRDVIWSDWGRPERISDTLRRIGKEPAFPLELLAAG
jgi:mannose-1-phosphate guanylyltransferase